MFKNNKGRDKMKTDFIKTVNFNINDINRIKRTEAFEVAMKAKLDKHSTDRVVEFLTNVNLTYTDLKITESKADGEHYFLLWVDQVDRRATPPSRLYYAIKVENEDLATGLLITIRRHKLKTFFKGQELKIKVRD